jgi:hypothetical protein
MQYRSKTLQKRDVRNLCISLLEECWLTFEGYVSALKGTGFSPYMESFYSDEGL